MDTILNKTSLDLLSNASKLLSINNLPIISPLIYIDGEYNKVVLKHLDENIPDFLCVSMLKTKYNSAKFNQLFQESLLAALLYFNPENFQKKNTKQ